MPYYKKSATVKHTIDSIFAQTYSNFELIIIYDDEDKKDLEYLKKIIKKSEKVLIIINQSNLGAGLSRNLGIKNAEENLLLLSMLMILDEKLEEQINFMKVNNFQVSHTSYNIIDINRNLISRRKARTFNTVKSLIKSCDIGLSTVIAKEINF